MCASAAIFSGCEFFGGYPITPSTEVMQILSRELPKYGGVVLQAEDEIAGVGAAVGASFAGKKSMTATCGPGMSLKTEMLGLASIAELPLVLLNVQRGGPSTGLPTKPEQARPLPGGVQRATATCSGRCSRPPASRTPSGITVEAFNLAEQYQTPVVILSDQEIAQRKETVDPIDVSRLEVLERLRPTPSSSSWRLPALRRDRQSGVSPLSHPGMQGGNYLAAGIEHDDKGAPTASGAIARGDEHEALPEARPASREAGPLRARRARPDAPLALVSWGSSAGVAREAFALARARRLAGQAARALPAVPGGRAGVPRRSSPRCRAGLVLELSHQGQLYRVLRMFVDVPPGVTSFARSGAQPFRADEVLERLEQLGGGPPMNALLAPNDYKSPLKPIWCPGCGDYGVLQALYRALSAVGRPPHEIAFISGIGCSSRIPGYTTAYGFNTVHGRALPIAQGVKLANPDLLVIVAGGDGDGFSIGGGHVPHAIRRNVDLTYLVMDNQVYGLTKGQLSPTSPSGLKTVTSPLGSLEQPINPLLIVLAYGAGFVAQATPADMPGMTALIEEAIRYPGFSFVNIQSPCVTFGEEDQQLKAHKARMKPLASLGHDPAEPARRAGPRPGVRHGAVHRRLLPEPQPASDVRRARAPAPGGAAARRAAVPLPGARRATCKA